MRDPKKLITSIHRFAAWAHAGEFALLNLRDEAPQFKGERQLRSKMKTAGKPPVEFHLADSLVDLKNAVAANDLTAAIPLYFYLRNLIGDPPVVEKRKRTRRQDSV